MTRNESVESNERICRSWLKLEYGLALGVFLFSVLFFTEGLNDILPFGKSDNNQYLFLAESLAQGQGYRDIFSAHLEPETRIPPGHPLLLALIIRFRGLDIPAIKIVQFVIRLLTGFLFLLIFLRFSTSPWEAVLGFALGLLSPFSVRSPMEDISAEVPYAFCVGLCLWLFVRSSPRLPSGLAIWLAGLSIAAGIMFRMQGLSLWLAALLTILIQERSRLISREVLGSLLRVSALPVGFLLVWLGRNYLFRGFGGMDYLLWFMGVHPKDEMLHPMTLSHFIGMVEDNCSYYLNYLFRFAFPVDELFHSVPAVPLGEGLIVVGLLWGLVKNLRSPQKIIGIYYLIFVLLLLGWVFQIDNYSTSTLFILPWLMIRGWNNLFFRRLQSRLPWLAWLKAVPVVCGAGWLAVFLLISSRYADHTIDFAISSPVRVGPRFQVAAPLVGLEQMLYLTMELRKKEDKGLLMCHSPQHIARALGRPCLDIPLLPPDQMLTYLEKENVRYLLIDQMFPRTQDFLVPTIQQHRDRFQLLLRVQEDHASVWAFNPPTPPQPGSAPK